MSDGPIFASSVYLGGASGNLFPNKQSGSAFMIFNQTLSQNFGGPVSVTVTVT